MNLRRLFKKKKTVCEADIVRILRGFVEACCCKIIVEVKIEGTVVTLRTNRPGVLIGRQGRDIERLRDRMREYGASKVILEEMKCIVSSVDIW